MIKAPVTEEITINFPHFSHYLHKNTNLIKIKN